MKNQFKILAFAAILLLTLAVCIASAIGANTILGAANAAPMSLAAIAVLFRPNPTPPPFVPPTPPSEPQYLTFTAQEENSSVGFYCYNEFEDPVNPCTTSLQYSIDNGETWNEYVLVHTIDDTETTMIVLPNVNDKVMFKGSNPYFSQANSVDDMAAYIQCIMYGQIAASGDITSLLNEVGGDVQLTKATFSQLFSDCASLTTAPNLPSSNLAPCCYFSMFSYCTLLENAPILPALTMFENCYLHMFTGCASLNQRISLPARNLAPNCYGYMFQNCTSLQIAPSLPATSLEEHCYQNMFAGCTALYEVPLLEAFDLAVFCCYSMFMDCVSLTTSPGLLATTLVQSCYENMFSGCSSLQYIECWATDISALNCTKNWLKNVSSLGRFAKPQSMNDWPSGVSGIPVGWTVEDAD